MPNWCENTVYVLGEKKAIQNLKDNMFSFKYIKPIPEHERDNWYNWCIENWGTKWDAGDKDANIDMVRVLDGYQLIVSMLTAWSPPIEIYQELETQGFDVEAYYVEPGMGFMGMYYLGQDISEEIPDSHDSPLWKKPLYLRIEEEFGTQSFLYDLEAFTNRKG